MDEIKKRKKFNKIDTEEAGSMTSCRISTENKFSYTHNFQNRNSITRFTINKTRIISSGAVNFDGLTRSCLIVIYCCY